MSSFRLLFAVLALVASVHALAGERINVDIANPPFMYERNGAAVGIYPALITAAFAHLGEPVTVEAKPWARALLEADNGSAGVGGIYKTAERVKKYDYSEPLFVETIVVYSNRRQPLHFTGVESLRGKQVGVIRGWSYGDTFDAMKKSGAITVEEVVGDAQNFGKLNAGRLDAVLAVAEAGRALLATGSYRDVLAEPTPLAVNPVHLIFNRSAGKTGLLRRFNVAVESMRKNGEFEAIVRRALMSH